MEKHLGWIVGGISALLIGMTTPLLVFAGTVQNGSTTSPVSVPSKIVVSKPVTGNAQSAPSASAVERPTLPYKIHTVDRLAVDAVGGGTVTDLSSQNSGNQSVWTVTVHQPSGNYQVQVSPTTYSVLGVKHV